MTEESDLTKPKLEERRIRLEERSLKADTENRRVEQDAKRFQEGIQKSQATFDRRYRLLELRERRADRALKLRELKINEGRGLRFTSAQATVAGATLALFSALVGAIIQGFVTRDVEAGKNKALISVEELKARSNIELEQQRQKAAEHLDRAKFETTLILKAIEAAKREDQIRNLRFFLNAGFIGDPEGKIAKIDENAYPSLPPPTTQTPADFYREYKGAIGAVAVGIADDDSVRLGTAFVVSKDGHALTAAHLLSGRESRPVSVAPRIEVSLGSRSGLKQRAELVKVDTELDLALIKLAGNVEYQHVKISREQVLIADPITVMGFPTNLELVVLLGSVSSVSEQGGRISLLLSVAPGQLGSPVFNKNGDVIAILVSSMDNHNLAVPIGFARSLLLASGAE
jgi:S1-C subfamily serine protease